ncbi:nitronate monooxygenase [Leucobacter sp. USHLN153]|uniref:nitronate monooxygenase n=1 Tax=Leucobacter sp. USHLN153 TaxID=3081268 RepID=UPI003018C260
MNESLLQTALPLVAAPMAGGTTTVALVESAARTGALGMVAGGYLSADALASQIGEVRGRGLEHFGVNLFVPDESAVDSEGFAQFAREISDEAAAYGLELDPHPRSDDDGWDEKVDLLCKDPVPLVSFTFGLAPTADIVRLQRAGSAVVATVTNAAEAQAAGEAGVDALIVQGPRAGGHSGAWDPHRGIADARTADVVAAVGAVTQLPLIAAGGVDGPAAVQALLSAGATSVQVGTLLLRSDEAGTKDVHREALADPHSPDTAITRAFTGRPARAIRNGFVSRHERHEITAYPAVHHLTRELRSRAAAAGDRDRVHLWAGTGYRAARDGAVADTLRWLASSL